MQEIKLRQAKHELILVQQASNKMLEMRFHVDHASLRLGMKAINKASSASRLQSPSRYRMSNQLREQLSFRAIFGLAFTGKLFPLI